MLYKFKSKAAGDLIMLEPHGRRVLEAIGKASGAQGVILPGQMAQAIAALAQAVAQEEAAHKDLLDAAKAAGKPTPDGDAPSLRQRAQPFTEMLQRSLAENTEIMWGV
jgi:cyclopropane-fatty-acyl-phospholipid synthase